MPSLTETGSLIIEYPTTSPTITLTLPAPKFGNTDSVKVKRAFNRARGLEIKSTKNAIWPRNDVFTFSFDSLTEDEKYGFLTLINTSLGKEVRLTDHENRVWIGFILEYNTQDNDDANSSRCDHALSFTFEGESE